MKKIVTTHMNAQRGTEFAKDSLDHLQEAYTEAISELLKGLVLQGVVTILNGVEMTVAGSTYTWTAGSVSYNNEVCLVDAGTLTVAGAQVPVFVENISYIAADPVLYDDMSTFNTHEIKKLKLQAGASGSGVADWDAVKYLNDREFIYASEAINESNMSNVFGQVVALRVGRTVYYTVEAHGTTIANQAYGIKCKIPILSNLYLGTVTFERFGIDPIVALVYTGGGGDVHSVRVEGEYVSMGCGSDGAFGSGKQVIFKGMFIGII